MKRILALAAVAALVTLPALPALAGTLDGGCSVDARSDLDTTDVVDTTRTDPFRIDPGGSVSWTATSPGAIENHEWEVGVKILGIPVRLFSGGDDNSAGTTLSEGSKSIPAEIERISNSQTSWILNNLGGVIEVFGSIEGEGGSCTGNGFISLEVGALDGAVGQIALGTTAAGLALMGLAGFAKKT